MFAQRHLSALLGGVLIAVVSLPATAAEPPKADVATLTDASFNSARANPASMEDPGTARAGQALTASRQDGQAGLPTCSSDPGSEHSRRCLRLAELPPPAPTAPAKMSAAASAPVAPLAAPARSWLGAVGKRIVAGVVGVAEAPYSDAGDWRAAMSAEIQSKLGQERPSTKRVASGS